jgi:hypothetical protein
MRFVPIVLSMAESLLSFTYDATDSAAMLEADTETSTRMSFGSKIFFRSESQRSSCSSNILAIKFLLDFEWLLSSSA